MHADINTIAPICCVAMLRIILAINCPNPAAIAATFTPPDPFDDFDFFLVPEVFQYDFYKNNTKQNHTNQMKE